jgi:hypothetical protein
MRWVLSWDCLLCAGIEVAVLNLDCLPFCGPFGGGLGPSTSMVTGVSLDAGPDAPGQACHHRRLTRAQLLDAAQGVSRRGVGKCASDTYPFLCGVGKDPTPAESCTSLSRCGCIDPLKTCPESAGRGTGWHHLSEI